jgi:hypothetical protein
MGKSQKFWKEFFGFCFELGRTRPCHLGLDRRSKQWRNSPLFICRTVEGARAWRRRWRRRGADLVVVMLSLMVAHSGSVVAAGDGFQWRERDKEMFMFLSSSLSFSCSLLSFLLCASFFWSLFFQFLPLFLSVKTCLFSLDSGLKKLRPFHPLFFVLSNCPHFNLSRLSCLFFFFLLFFNSHFSSLYIVPPVTMSLIFSNPAIFPPSISVIHPKSSLPKNPSPMCVCLPWYL